MDTPCLEGSPGWLWFHASSRDTERGVMLPSHPPQLRCRGAGASSDCQTLPRVLVRGCAFLRASHEATPAKGGALGLTHLPEHARL